MVSEDSQGFGRLPMVHRLSDLCDLDEPGDGEMPSKGHHGDDQCELLEVLSLRRSQRVLPEERNDRVSKVGEPLHAIPEEVFLVIVVPAVPVHPAASEEACKILEHVPARCSLDDGKLRASLPSQSHRVASVDGTAETSLSVHEPDDPSDRLESFLLIFRTLHIVTARHAFTLETRCDIPSE
jgi:hypothetical protein